MQTIVYSIYRFAFSVIEITNPMWYGGRQFEMSGNNNEKWRLSGMGGLSK